MDSFFRTADQLLNTPFLNFGNASLTLSAIAQFFLVLLMALLFSLSFKRVFANQILSRLGLKQGTRESIATITSYSLAAILVLILLQAIGVNLASVAVLAGSLGIGIGFGLQDITRNFISGIAMLVERKLKVGDFVEWEGLSGYIIEISLRSTIIRTITERHIVIPNSNLVSNQVTNWTYNNFKGWVPVNVSVAHESDPVLVIEALLDSAYLEEAVSYEYPPEVLFTGFGQNSLDFVLWIWVDRVDLKHKTESSLRFIIDQNLRQHHIRLASPRYDLWHRNPNVVVQSSVADYADQAWVQQAVPTFSETSAKPVAVRDLLQKIPYFADCTTVELRKLVEIGYRRRLEAGEVLYKVGDPGDAFYIILYGSVGYTLDNQEQPTVMAAGQFIGEFSLMLGIPRTVTVAALEDTTVFAISPQGFKQILQSQPRLYDLIVQEMGRHEVELNQQKRRLRELGLINQDYDKNPVAWVQKQLEKLFGSQPH
ncbi:mechanosensitive ion channel domain-containing protein [Pseudanabaena sp. FACHB-2040]|uniref:mechanosensitive ion channel domain-containing protein n=1 Tax=Pseudanabaena sp. FACHB-2040 TaxID=2692859 RepID=UPI001681F636|nr:mechanosensitive ion channel domain-containing protein [Pseudanabaena sp. FACHB-2040]MBD2258377.1 mechanosensitive ion channel [Pseudanabaena sp. FACHB-2040]